MRKHQKTVFLLVGAALLAYFWLALKYKGGNIWRYPHHAQETAKGE